MLCTIAKRLVTSKEQKQLLHKIYYHTKGEYQPTKVQNNKAKNPTNPATPIKSTIHTNSKHTKQNIAITKLPKQTTTSNTKYNNMRNNRTETKTNSDPQVPTSQQNSQQQFQTNQLFQQTQLQQSNDTQDGAWKALVKTFSERNALSFLDPLLLEEALSHRFVVPNIAKTGVSRPCNDRLAFYGYALAELQLTEYYMDVLPRGAQLATKICLKHSNLFIVGQSMGLDALLHHRFLSTNSYELIHPLPESKRLELATAESVLALAAAIHLQHKVSRTDPTPLFSHRLIALPLTLSQLIKEHRPRQVLDAFLRTRPRPAHSPQPPPWGPQTQPPATAHSMFAIYRVLEEIKASPHISVGVYVDGKLLTTEYGATKHEAEEMAAMRALEILRRNVALETTDMNERESEQVNVSTPFH